MQEAFNNIWSTETIRKQGEQFHQDFVTAKQTPSWCYRGVNWGEGNDIQKVARKAMLTKLRSKQAKRGEGLGDANPIFDRALADVTNIA